MVADVESSGDHAGTPRDNVGLRLRCAREALGMSLVDIAAATKIPERLLALIEAGQFSALPSLTYAIGFSRSYARAVGLDETGIADSVRAELDGPIGQAAAVTPAFVPGDPARVPGRRLAVIAALGAVVVAAGALLYWRTTYEPEGPLPSILPTGAPVAVKKPAQAAPAGMASAALPAPGGVVTLSATEAGIWVKIYEAAGKTLFEGQMKQGQSFTVPADAQAPLIWTGRPDALAVTVGGKTVAPLADKQKIIKGVPITAAALLARPAVTPAAPLGLPQATRK